MTIEKYPALNLPPAELKIREADGCAHIWDKLRRRWLVLTPEEWVRQNFIAFLAGHCAIDEYRIAQEHRLVVNGMDMRADIVVFSRTGQPVLVVECKAPSVPIGQAVIEQVSRYNSVMNLEYAAVTNGLSHYCWQIDHEGKSFHFIPKIPEGI